jgi:hypothetical protein
LGYLGSKCFQNSQVEAISFDLIGETIGSSFDNKTLKRFQDLQYLEESKRNTLFDLIDTYIRDAKARKAYAQ